MNQSIAKPRLARPLATLMAIAGVFWIGLESLPLTACAGPTRSGQVEVTNGMIEIDHRPFFPMGFYHVSWGLSSKKQLQHLNQIAAAGFNIIHASANDLEGYEKFLNRAHQLGVYVISEHHFDPLLFVKRFKHKPSVLAWNLADDVDNGKRTPAQILELHRILSAEDPMHPTYISGYSKRLPKFSKCANIIGRQSYPIRQHTSAELSQTHPDIADIAHSLSGSQQQTVFANLQVFPWAAAGPPETGSAPHMSEVRNMTYQAILGGAKGILYYTYYDKAWFLPDHPQLWQGLKVLNRQVQSLSLFFLEGTFNPLELASKKVIGGIWVKGNSALLVMANTSATSIETIQHKLGPMAWGKEQKAEPLFDSAPAKQQPGGTLEFSLPPKGVYIYQISKDLEGTTNARP